MVSLQPCVVVAPCFLGVSRGEIPFQPGLAFPWLGDSLGAVGENLEPPCES